MCKGGGGSTTSTATQTPPKAVQQAYSNISSLAEQAASRPLQQYTGPMLAGFTDMQNQGFAGVNSAQNTLQPYLNSASGLIGQGTQNIYSQLPQYNAQNIQQYQNPYQKQVIDATMAQIQQQNQIQQQQLTGNAISQGAWGGDRAAVAQGVLGGQQAMATNSTLAGLNSQGFQQAQQEFNQQQGTQLQALQNQAGLDLQGAGLQGYLGNAALSGQLGVANAQMQAGNQQQAQAQNALNIPYQQFLQQQAYPFQTTQFLANTLLGTAGTQGGTSTNTQPSQTGSGAAQIAGLGMQAAGLYMMSDKRVKDDIRKVGKLDNGLPVYTFKYKGDDTVHMGLMAQDVEKKNPDAVGEVNGIKTVNYDKAAREKHALGGAITGYASGGVPDVDVNFVPLQQMNYGGIGLPGVPQIQQPQNNGMAGLGAGMNELAMGARMGNPGAISWNPGQQGLFAGQSSNMYGPGFDSGGAVVNVPKTQNSPQTSFVDLGGQTGKVPVYSFNAPGAVSDNNGYSSSVPNTMDYNKLQNFSMSPLATHALSVNPGSAFNSNQGSPSSGGQLSLDQFSNALKGNPNYLNVLGATNFGSIGDDTPQANQAKFTLQNPNAINNLYKNNYQANPGQYGFAKGGGIKGYAGGSDVPGFDLPEAFVGGTNSIDDGTDNSAAMRQLLMSQMGGTSALPQVPDASISPLVSVLGSNNGTNGSLSIPNPGLQPSRAINGGLSIPDATQAAATPTAATSGLDLGSINPGLALSEAGAAMMASPSRNPLQALGQGALEGYKTYADQKAAQVTAQEKAEELAQQAEKLSQGNYQLGYQKDADGNLTPVAFNTKTGEPKILSGDISLQGKAGAKPAVTKDEAGNPIQYDPQADNGKGGKGAWVPLIIAGGSQTISNLSPTGEPITKETKGIDKAVLTKINNTYDPSSEMQTNQAANTIKNILNRNNLNTQTGPISEANRYLPFLDSPGALEPNDYKQIVSSVGVLKAQAMANAKNIRNINEFNAITAPANVLGGGNISAQAQVDALVAHAKEPQAENSFFNAYYDKYGTLSGSKQIWGKYSVDNDPVSRDKNGTVSGINNNYFDPANMQKYIDNAPDVYKQITHPSAKQDSSNVTQGSQAPASAPALAGPKVGDIVRGYKFLGGNPNDQKSWQSVQ